MPQRRLPRFQGPRPRADDINKLYGAIEANGSYGAGAGFYVHSSAIGFFVADVRDKPILGILTGTSGAGYTWDFAGATAGGGHTSLGDGLSIAYELNGKTGLPVGTVVELYPGDGAEKLFQWVGFATYIPCGGTTRVCLSITSGCTSMTPGGATVVVKDNTGTTIGTCTADGSILSLTLTSAGSGYTNGTGYSLGFSGGGGSGVAGTFDVVGGQITNLVLTNGGTGYSTAPTISFPGAGSGSGASATANLVAKCCVSVPDSGPYTITTSVPGTTPITSSVNAVCNTDANVSAAFPSNSLGRVCFSFTHCGYANGGDTIVVSKAGSPVATFTTDGSGNACAVLAAGSYTAVLTTPHGSTKNLSFSVTACTTTNVNAGSSIATCCVRIRTDVTGGCTGTVTIKNQDTSSPKTIKGITCSNCRPCRAFGPAACRVVTGGHLDAR